VRQIKQCLREAEAQYTQAATTVASQPSDTPVANA
jgi:hypothetical protein